MPINGWSLRNTSKITSRGYESLAKAWVSITMIARRFPPPWSIDELEAWHARQATAGRRVQRFP
jgi:hypothetical protein